MIRSDLPLPFLYRLKLNAGAAARRGAEASAPARGSRHAATRRPAAGSAAQLWEDFIDRYETFTGVLCAAAKSGCDGDLESEYAQLRRWFVTSYYRIAGRLRPALEADFFAEVYPTHYIADYSGQKRALDPLESLFLPATLHDVLNHDAGDLIPRIMRISETVYRCYDEWTTSQTN